ncbi:hypothetical protein [Streptomyces sp. NPDC057580]
MMEKDVMKAQAHSGAAGITIDPNPSNLAGHLCGRCRLDQSVSG